MAINVSQAFHRTSANPVDDTLTLTKAQMLAVNDNLMPSKYLTICQDDGFIYLYDKTNTADEQTGKFRKFEGGGGGHEIVDADDTALTQRNQLKFGDGFTVEDDDTDEQTVVTPNVLEEGDMDEIVYPLPDQPHPDTSCGYTPVGTIISVMGVNAPLHYLACNGQVVNIADYPELADYFEAQFGLKNKFGGNGTTTFGIPDLRGEFLRGTGTNSHTNQGNGANVGTHQDATEHIAVFNDAVNNNIVFDKVSNSTYSAEVNRDTSIKITGSGGAKYQSFSVDTSNTGMETMYTARPTNTSVLYCIATKDIYINPFLDYSTSEKVVGRWINGATLYQKTIDCGALPNNDVKNVNVGVTGITVVKMSGIAIREGQYDLPLPYTGVDASSSPTDTSVREREIALHYAESLNQLVIRTYTDRSAWTNTYVTIQYTKSST